MRFLLAALAVLTTLVGLPARALSPADLVKAELVAEPLAVRPGEPFWVGIRLRMKQGWHTYWRNPGDSGLPTEAKWTLPDGFAAGAIVWPAPERIPVGPLANYGYKGETLLLVPITPVAELDRARPLSLKAQVSWLVCETECVPGEASLALDLPVAAPDTNVGTNPRHREAFAAARARLPAPAPWPVRAEIAPDRIALSWEPTAGPAPRSASFFPYSETLVENAAPQHLAAQASGLRLTAKRASPPGAAPASVAGVLVLDGDGPGAGGPRAYEIAAPATPVASLGPEGTPLSRPRATIDLGEIVTAALLAFLGGLILNLMPCVFPVLSIKVLSLLRPGETPGHLRWHGLAYTGGVLLTFGGLAGTLLALRAGGAEIGWGFQLQSPIVVTLLALVLFAMGLSLSGLFHLGSSLAGIGDRLAGRSGISGSFFGGVLATVVSTPCTAPFMGAATGFALTQGAPVALAVFLAMGLGLAAPFLALTFMPAWLARLPRPGAWMETLKQALAFPLYATTAWLLWVLSQEVGSSGLFLALMALVLVAFAGWCLALSQRGEGPGSRVAQGFAATALVLVALSLAGVARDRRPEGASVAAIEGGAEPFSEARLASLLAEGRPVFVNMTAAWCLTCIVNERAALARDSVQAAFAQKNVAYLKGDWTNRNSEITRVLERHGRSGVPLYLLYTGQGEPMVLPQLLTPGTVLASLEALPTAIREQRAAIGRASER